MASNITFAPNKKDGPRAAHERGREARREWKRREEVPEFYNPAQKRMWRWGWDHEDGTIKIEIQRGTYVR